MQSIKTSPPGPVTAHIDVLKGFKSNINTFSDFAEALSAHGSSVNIAGFAPPGKRTDLLYNYYLETRDFFLQTPQNNALNTLRLATVHSLGGFLLLESLTDPYFAERFAEKYDAIFMANPFTGDRYHHLAVCNIFSNSAYAKDAIVGTTAVERGLSMLKGDFIGANSIPGDLPTHAQGMAFHFPAVRLINKLSTEGLPDVLSNMPISIITEKNDPACQNSYTEQLKDSIGADLLEFDTHYTPQKDTVDPRHNLLLYHEPAQQLYLHWVQEMRKHKLGMEAAPLASLYEQVSTETKTSDQAQTTRHVFSAAHNYATQTAAKALSRFRFPLQGGARTLDTVASLG